MSDLINRLRDEAEYKADEIDADKREMFEWKVADALEAQAKEIAELNAEVERKMSAASFTIDKYKALCDQLGNALEIGWSPYYVNGVDAKVLAEEALAAWRATE